MKSDRHTQNAEARIRDLAHRLRRDVETVIEPKAHALLKTSAEVLGGLITSFDEYRARRTREREREDAPAASATPASKRAPRRKATRRRTA